MKPVSECDPKALIHEAYRIEGITASECRTIFLDWALSLPLGRDSRADLGTLLDTYGGDAPDHPMTGVLKAGLDEMAQPKRRGGWRGRSRGRGDDAKRD